MKEEICQAHSGISSDIKTLKDENEKQWSAIDKLRNRPPVWATAVISLLTFLLGCTITYAALAIKVSGLAK